MTNKEFADGLRRIARVYEENEDVKLPYNQGDMTIYCHHKAELAAAVRAFGAGEKKDEEGCMVFLPSTAPGIRIIGFKDGICERVCVGLKELPEVVVPAKAAEPEMVIPARVVEVYEWRCSPLLSGEDEAVI